MKRAKNEENPTSTVDESRRNVLIRGAALIASTGLGMAAAGADTTLAAGATVSDPSNGMDFKISDTAVVFIDPQNDVLSEKGTSWAAVGASVTENHTVENMARIFEAAKTKGYDVFISPHYFYPTDSSWKFNGPLEAEEFRTHTFARSGPLTLEGFANSGADWLDRFKPYIEDGQTVVVSPHKVWGPQTNDLVLQLLKRRVNKVVLAGMLANLCAESHLRELLEQGFEVAVVKDATAGPRHPQLGDGYRAALINFGFLANAVLTTDDAVKAMR